MMKKSGMTWKIQVSHCVHGAMYSMSESVNASRSIVGAAMSQWPSTTTTIDAARRKST